MESEGDDNTNDMEDDTGNMSDDNLGSCGSVDDAKTPPDDDNESLNQSLSSPGCLSGLSSLQSPSTSLASPLTPNTLMHNNNNNTINSNNNTTNGIGNANPNLLGSTLPTTPSSNSADTAVSMSTSNATSNSQKSSFTEVTPSTSITICGSSASASPINGGTNNAKNNTNLNDVNPNTNSSHNSDDETHKSSSTSSSSLYSSKLKSSSASGDLLKNSEKSTLLHNHGMNIHQHHLQHQYQQQKMFLQQQQQLKQPLPHVFHFLNQDLLYEKINRSPVGANPRDINNPLSINQLTKRNYVNNSSHHLMGVPSVSNASHGSPDMPTHIPPQLFPPTSLLNPSANQTDFHHFTLPQELLNHQQHQQNSLVNRTSQPSPTLSYQSAISQHFQSRAFAASMMSAQHPYSHSHGHPAFSVAPDVAVAAVQQPPTTPSVTSSNSRRCVSEDSAGGAISVT